MYAIATGFHTIEPGLIMTSNPDFAWEMFFRNVRDGYSTKVRFKEDFENREVGYNHHTKKFTYRDY